VSPREFEQLAIYHPPCRLVFLLYQRGGLVFAPGLKRRQSPNPPQVATCGFFVETSG
jgi:hypothetical protein